MKKKKLIISWVLRILLSLGFLLASLGKISGSETVIEMFDNWGFPEGFYLVIGILELLLACALLIPKTLKIALIGLSVIMIGALVTHLIHDPVLQAIRPVLFLVFLITIYYLNFYKLSVE